MDMCYWNFSNTFSQNTFSQNLYVIHVKHLNYVNTDEFNGLIPAYTFEINVFCNQPVDLSPFCNILFNYVKCLASYDPTPKFGQ